jgi:hypothetical protein
MGPFQAEPALPGTQGIAFERNLARARGIMTARSVLTRAAGEVQHQLIQALDACLLAIGATAQMGRFLPRQASGCMIPIEGSPHPTVWKA